MLLVYHSLVVDVDSMYDGLEADETRSDLICNIKLQQRKVDPNFHLPSIIHLVQELLCFPVHRVLSFLTLLL